MTLHKVNELTSQNVTLFLQPKNILKANISIYYSYILNTDHELNRKVLFLLSVLSGQKRPKCPETENHLRS